VIIDFTVLNQGRTAIINGIFLEILEVLDRPEQALGSCFMPVLEPIEDTAVLTREQALYRLFCDQVFSYKEGDVDLFRVNVLVADAEGPMVFRFRFEIDYAVGSRRGKAHSQDFYLAKFQKGRTARIPYAKSKMSPHTKPDLPAAVEYTAANAIPGREEFSTEGSYYRGWQFRTKSKESNADGLAAHIQQNYWAAVMSGNRDETQKKGLSRVPPIEALDTGGLQTSWVCFKASGDRGYESQVHGEFEIYTGRDTPEYHALAAACARLGEIGTPKQQEAVAQSLIDATQNPTMDTAGVTDTIPLLACFRCKRAFEFLAFLLKCGNTVVEKNAAEVFGSIVYSGARERLLEIVKQPRSYASSAALRALGLNGNEHTAKLIVELYGQERFHPTETEVIAAVVFRSAPAWASQIARDYVAGHSAKQRQLACELLTLMKKPPGGHEE